MSTLRVRRKYLELEVRRQPGGVRVIAVAFPPAYAETARLIAHSEEVVTTMHLRYIHSSPTNEYLETYFRRRGWEVL